MNRVMLKKIVLLLLVLALATQLTGCAAIKKFFRHPFSFWQDHPEDATLFIPADAGDTAAFSADAGDSDAVMVGPAAQAADSAAVAADTRAPAAATAATRPAATAAGNLQVEVTAVPQREGAMRFAEHGGLNIPPGRTAQSRWQVTGTTENPRWDWLTPFPVDTVIDPEPYLVPPAAMAEWDADWQRAINLPVIAPANLAGPDTAPARRQAVRP